MVYIKHILTSLAIVAFVTQECDARCGCKMLSSCYQHIQKEVLKYDEVLCVEDAASGSATFNIFMHLLTKFCSNNIKIHRISETFEGRGLHEFTLGEGDKKPTIVIDAGQEGGTAAVDFALYIVQQLLACEENRGMLEKVQWVVMPNTNPDGLEFNRLHRASWVKNARVAENRRSIGVNIARNFDAEFEACEKKNPQSPHFVGSEAFSEQESAFVKTAFDKYRNTIKAYVSIRRDGHSILYPHAHSSKIYERVENISAIAGVIAAKVNNRAGLIQRFLNQSIFNYNGKAVCGHSVDYASTAAEVPLAFEMRVFLDGGILRKFHKLPVGFEASLRAGYFAGIKELYQQVLLMAESNVD